MGIQQSHVSRTRRNSRRGHHKVELVSGGLCPKCGAVKRSHHICPSCGFYKDREVISVDQE